MPYNLLFKYPADVFSTKILIGEELNPDLTFLQEIGNRFAIITDQTVEEIFGKTLFHRLQKEGLPIELFSFPPGDEFKTRETKQMIENKMLEQKLGRDTCIIALGGGVVTDLAGFIAATYCRGIPYISIPTTLLAMVDASIGGKVGVNTPLGKNLIGSFYPPHQVLMDLASLQTLPEKEWRSGAAEILKYGLIASKDLFELMDRRKEEWRSHSRDFLEEIIYASCLIKKKTIESDFKEKGLRRILNFGHTIGHAIEAESYFQVSHGDAVAVGMLLESFLSMKLGLLDIKSLDKIHTVLKKYHFPLMLPEEKNLLARMALDKKAKKNTPRFALLSKIGEAASFKGEYCIPIEEALIKEALDWMRHA